MRTPTYIEEMFAEHGDSIKSEIASLNLDQSQTSALDMALKNEVALIQGPPGTGKTYIGVQIVRILLQYKQFWNTEGPILIVTYSNHALNQFLNQIKSYTKNIVKIGGKMTEGLEQFSYRTKLSNLPKFNGHSTNKIALAQC